jgi:altronate hydrolase
MSSKVLQLDPRDNVLIALTDLRAGEQVTSSGATYELASDVRAKHKFVTRDLPTGGQLYMYGVLVGQAVEPIQRGQPLTTRNVRHDTLHFQAASREFRWDAPDVTGWRQRSFLGYQRSDGQVGTRNYWLFVPLVFCENRNIGVLKQAFEC